MKLLIRTPVRQDSIEPQERSGYENTREPQERSGYENTREAQERGYE